MVVKSLLAKISLRVILPLVVILVIVFSVGYWGSELAEDGGTVVDAEALRENVEKVIGKFMEAGASRNIRAAYACWSRESASEEDIVEFIERRYEVFAGYEGLTISYMDWETGWYRRGVTGHRMLTMGGGSVESLFANGTINHSGGKVLRLEAWLVQENDFLNIWKISDMRLF